MDFICDLTTPGNSLNTITTAPLIKKNLEAFCQEHGVKPDTIISAIYRFNNNDTHYTISIACVKCGKNRPAPFVSKKWLKENPLDRAAMWVFDGSFGSGDDPMTATGYRTC